MDSVIHLLNNWGLVDSAIQRFEHPGPDLQDSKLFVMPSYFCASFLLFATHLGYYKLGSLATD